MKNKRLMDALSLADEKFIEEAAPTGKGRRQVRFSSLHRVACACLAFAIAVAVFVPLSLRNDNTPELPPSEDGGTAPDIEDGGTAPDIDPNDQPKPAEGYEKIFAALSAMFDNAGSGGSIGNGSTGDNGSTGSDSSTNTDNSTGSQQIVDNQTADVDEADIIKRTDTHIFYLSTTLDVYSIDGESSRLISRISYLPAIEGYDKFNHKHKEMLLTSDGKTLALILELTSKTNAKDKKTAVVTYDVSTPSSPIHIETITIAGKYSEARLTLHKYSGEIDVGLFSDQILVFTEYSLTDKPITDDLSSYVPYTEIDGQPSYLSDSEIFIPEVSTSLTYTVMVQINAKTSSVTSCYALLGFNNSTVYVSENSVYVLREYWQEFNIFTDNNNTILINPELLKYGNMTQIVRYDINVTAIPVAPILFFAGDVAVNGTLKNRYCIDEYNGVLRIVADAVNTTEFDHNGTSIYYSAKSANLYCFNVKTLEKIAEVIAFAPEGETVQSVRFDGNYAYVCTALIKEKPVDPVFFFDLSDLNNITYTDTGTLPGFSTSLIQFKNGKLVGIGSGENALIMKLEAYAEEDGKVISVDQYETVMLNFSQNYKSYLIDRDEGYIGFAGFTVTEHQYTLVRFDGEKFEEITKIPLSDHYTRVRAFISDGYLYVVNPKDLKVVKLS